MDWKNPFRKGPKALDGPAIGFHPVMENPELIDQKMVEGFRDG